MDSNFVKRKPYLLPLILALLLATNVAAENHLQTISRQPLMTHDFLLESVSWVAITFSCSAGDTLSGEFILTNNGDLFIGDQTKYDNWLLDGIDFLILDATNYSRWIDDIPVDSIYEMKGVVELQWSIEIPSDGAWYIIYHNDSIFMKQVEGNIQHISQIGNTYTLVFVSLLGLATLLILSYAIRKKK